MSFASGLESKSSKGVDLIGVFKAELVLFNPDAVIL